MSIHVDHKRRKSEILAKSIKLFARDGYKDVTFQLLADYCGLARTALYRYFHNKRQIFDAAILEAERRIALQYVQVLRTESSAAMRLERICAVVATQLYENREFLSVIVDFILSMAHAGHDMSRRVVLHTIMVRRLFHSLVAEGVRRGEFRASLSPDAATDLLYAIVEAHVLRLTVSNSASLSDALMEYSLVIDSFKKESTSGK